MLPSKTNIFGSIISICFLAPDFALNKFYPKYNYFDINQIQKSKLDTKKEVRIKIEKSYAHTEKIRKTYVSHRDANVIDGSFIKLVIRECIIVE